MKFIVRLLFAYVAFLFVLEVIRMVLHGGISGVFFAGIIGILWLLVFFKSSLFNSLLARVILLIIIALSLPAITSSIYALFTRCKPVSYITTPGAICQDPSLSRTYSPSHDSYHDYDVKTCICDKSVHLNCTESLVFNTMLSQARFQGPTTNKDPVTQCGQVCLDIGFFGVRGFIPMIGKSNPIKVMIDSDTYTATNYTANYDHVLHPGYVDRKITNVNNKIYVKSFGEGTGALQWFNDSNFLMEHVMWKYVDRQLKREVANKLNINIDNCGC